jgi:hypothetical protein
LRYQIYPDIDSKSQNIGEIMETNWLVRIMRTGWLSWVRADDKAIIEILESQGANLVLAASSLVELLTCYNAVRELRSRIKDLEHETRR